MEKRASRCTWPRAGRLWPAAPTAGSEGARPLRPRERPSCLGRHPRHCGAAFVPMGGAVRGAVGPSQSFRVAANRSIAGGAQLPSAPMTYDSFPSPKEGGRVRAISCFPVYSSCGGLLCGAFRMTVGSARSAAILPTGAEAVASGSPLDDPAAPQPPRVSTIPPLHGSRFDADARFRPRSTAGARRRCRRPSVEADCCPTVAVAIGALALQRIPDRGGHARDRRQRRGTQAGLLMLARSQPRPDSTSAISPRWWVSVVVPSPGVRLPGGVTRRSFAGVVRAAVRRITAALLYLDLVASSRNGESRLGSWSAVL